MWRFYKARIHRPGNRQVIGCSEGSKWFQDYDLVAKENVTMFNTEFRGAGLGGREEAMALAYGTFWVWSSGRTHIRLFIMFLSKVGEHTTYIIHVRIIDIIVSGKTALHTSCRKHHGRKILKSSTFLCNHKYADMVQQQRPRNKSYQNYSMSLSGADVSGTLKSEKENRICDTKVIVTVKGMIQVKLEIKKSERWSRLGENKASKILPWSGKWEWRRV